MLRAEEIEVRYGSVVANKHVSLTVSEGETVALLGPNGAGKTTFLSAVAGLVPISSGFLVFDDDLLAGMSPERVVRKGISLVPENRRIFGSLTVRENLIVGAAATPPDQEATILSEVLEMFPILGERSHQKAGLLSGGEQQQLAIARALMSKPRLLLLDEPSLGLAPMLVDRIFETIASLRSGGMTILLVEQNARKAIAMADRVYILRSGRMTSEMSGEEAAADRIAIENEYFGEEEGAP